MLIFTLAAALAATNPANTDADTVEMPADEPMVDAWAGYEPEAVEDLGPVAIECNGRWHEGEPFGESVAKDRQVRRYVIDFEAQMVSYWNEYREVAFPACDQKFRRCDVSFDPTRISVDGQLNSQGSFLLRLNRRTGGVEHVQFSKGQPTMIYRGTCARTEMPVANVDRNIF